MKRRVLSMILSAALAMTMLSACAVPAASSAPAAGEAAEAVTEAAEAVEEAAEAVEEAAEAVDEADDQLAAILSAGKFVVGIEGTYPPFTYHDDNGDLAGYDVEVAQKIAEKLGVEAEFVEAAWDSLLIGVDTGRFDTVINQVSITPERQEKYDFSDPYYYNARTVIVRGDDDRIKTEDDLKGMKVATNLTNAYIGWLEERGAEVVGVDTSGESAEMLLSGRVDFTNFSQVVLNDYLKEHPEADLKVAFVIPNSEARVGVPIRKGEDRLVEKINEILQELRDEGTLQELSIKYFDQDFTNSVENN
ncbi:MAG: transporter substrate-binding domain-containing protein [Lachnospiraceae bacterium]|nr:transporter substrate-binding domain-containing protein [Lachnospiraceae bacterium]